MPVLRENGSGLRVWKADFAAVYWSGLELVQEVRTASAFPLKRRHGRAHFAACRRGAGAFCRGLGPKF